MEGEGGMNEWGARIGIAEVFFTCGRGWWRSGVSMVVFQGQHGEFAVRNCCTYLTDLCLSTSTVDN